MLEAVCPAAGHEQHVAGGALQGRVAPAEHAEAGCNDIDGVGEHVIRVPVPRAVQPADFEYVAFGSAVDT